MSESSKLEKKLYWDDFYKKINKEAWKIMPPSQFAVFCCSEIFNKNIKHVVDIASGDGRDSIFFAQQGLKVFALEKSAQAVKLLEKRNLNNENLSIIQIDALKDKIDTGAPKGLSLAYYSRFFIHTLSKNEVKIFFKKLSEVVGITDYLFVEYRNEFDANLKKETEAHFREFHKSNYILDIANQFNLDCVYEVSGTGFAKWKQDDACVTRQIFIKTIKKKL